MRSRIRRVAFLLVLAACGGVEPATTLPPAPTTSSSTTTTSTTSTTVPSAVVTVRASADRGVMIPATDTVPVPTAREICAAQTYSRQNDQASGVCFRAVTAERGWSLELTEAWAPFVLGHPGILHAESEHCPFRRGGDLVTDDCVTTRQGHAEDTGFGQATRAWWGSNGLLCRRHAVCSAAQILADAYSSMLYSVVLLIEYDGSGPWCYDRRAVRLHHCWNAPDR